MLLFALINGPWLTDWASPIFEGPLVLDFNTCNILDLNRVLLQSFSSFLKNKNKKNTYFARIGSIWGCFSPFWTESALIGTNRKLKKKEKRLVSDTHVAAFVQVGLECAALRGTLVLSRNWLGKMMNMMKINCYFGSFVTYYHIWV